MDDAVGDAVAPVIAKVVTATAAIATDDIPNMDLLRFQCVSDQQW